MNRFETKHTTPEQVKEEGYIPVHMLTTYNEKGEAVGFAELQYFGGKPSFYFVTNLGNTTVNTKEDKEVGVGHEVITKLNAFLDEKKKAGYLANTSGISDLYTKRGWTQSKLFPDFNYYGELSEADEREILARLQKWFPKKAD